MIKLIEQEIPNKEQYAKKTMAIEMLQKRKKLIDLIWYQKTVYLFIIRINTWLEYFIRIRTILKLNMKITCWRKILYLPCSVDRFGSYSTYLGKKIYNFITN